MRKFILTLIFISIFLCSTLLVMYYTRTYTVTFNTRGGTIYPSLEIPTGDKVTRPEDPLMAGYIFVGWFDEEGKEFDFNQTINEDTMIVAHFDAIDTENVNG